LINDKGTLERTLPIAKEIFGSDNVLEFEPKMWAEDFASYSQIIPGLFWFLGVKPKGANEMPALHNSKLSPDESAIVYGTAMLVACALDYL
jgi:metal-dependent amidase/aminoacylase/carboxypeptidase family protein